MVFEVRGAGAGCMVFEKGQGPHGRHECMVFGVRRGRSELMLCLSQAHRCWVTTCLSCLDWINT